MKPTREPTRHRAPTSRSAGRSECGPRPRNEDGFFRRECGTTGIGLYAVADGLGGRIGGRVASQRVIDRLDRGFDRLVAALARADADRARVLADFLVALDDDLREVGAEDPVLTGLGTTLTLVAIAGDELAFAHVGDSRLYVFSPGQTGPASASKSNGHPARGLVRLTEDMNLAARLLREGEISEAEYESSPYRAQLLGYLGKGDLRPQIGSVTLDAPSRVVLATDGLFPPLHDEDIEERMRGAGDPDVIAQELIELAVARGTRDNVTVVCAVVADANAGPTRDRNGRDASGRSRSREVVSRDTEETPT